MTTFAELDPILEDWSRERRIPLSTEYKDEEVRSFQLVDQTGGQYQIWIDVERGLTVSVWDFGKKRHDFSADLGSLRERLDDALNLARSWM